MQGMIDAGRNQRTGFDFKAAESRHKKTPLPQCDNGAECKKLCLMQKLTCAAELTCVERLPCTEN